MPHARFTFLWIGPAELFLIGGGGYEAFDSNSAFGFKFGTGIVLPLGARYELMSDVSFTLTPIGTPGTPVMLDWLLGFGFKFGS